LGSVFGELYGDCLKLSYAGQRRAAPCRKGTGPAHL